ncbi:hypothetical protein [Novosphingobium decolorationis]|uniref:Lipoprotein n=1 Tax=Novosphingobium decolorationis TaxID=2698673 RepID=A0ABX8E3L7_9SPHN|nr:hypothetical protein [Novosphingobium decolorationis]QVM83528.1 hypothetical protein HT578_07345 [Novosphingobium decolorationis]
MISISMRRAAALGLALPLLAGLAACKDDAREAPSAEAAQGAELLPRSVDDAMPLYDQRRSQAPLAEPELAEPNQGSASAAPTQDSEDTAGDTTEDGASAAQEPSAPEEDAA